MTPTDDKTLMRIKLWAGVGAGLMAAGFGVAMFLVTHYASAADMRDLSGRVNDVAGQVQEHRALIDSMRDDLKYIRDGLDELRRRR